MLTRTVLVFAAAAWGCGIWSALQAWRLRAGRGLPASVWQRAPLEALAAEAAMHALRARIAAGLCLGLVLLALTSTW
jgi:hypothetical protein